MYPVIAKFGPFTIYSYGVMVAIAFLIGVYFACREARRKDISRDLIYDLALYVLLGALIGARIYYILFFDPGVFIKDPLSVLKIWQGGLAIHGGIIGGVVSGLLFSKKRNLPFWRLADIFAPSVMLGQAIGRIGCFLNDCCYGIPTDSFLGVTFPGHNLAVHPTQLYESFFDFIGVFILWAVRKRIKFNGGLFLLYLMVYSLIRVVISAFRGDSLYIWGTHFKIAQIISAIILVSACIVFIKRKKNA